MTAIVWEHEKVVALLNSAPNAFYYARIKTPHGVRSQMKRWLGRSLERKCFANCIMMAAKHPDKFWYCEGYANHIPHAWLSPKVYHGMTLDENWALDPTWPWYSRTLKRDLDNVTYAGIQVDGVKAKQFLLDRLKTKGPGSISLLKYPDEIQHLLVLES